MNNWIVIGICAGLAAAAMQVAVASGTSAGLFLFFVVPLPLFLAGLGWGAVSAAVGAIVSAGLLVALSSVKTGLLFLLSTGLAPVLLSHLSLINRPASGGPSSEGEAADSDTEWYPEGRLMLWCAGVVLVVTLTSIFAYSGSFDALQAEIRGTFDKVIEEVRLEVSPEQLVFLRRMANFISLYFAPLIASSWLLSTLLNMWIASSLLTSSGRSHRPWAPFSSYALPKSAAIVLAALTVASFVLSGMPGMIASTGLALMLTIYGIIGLAALHGLTLGRPRRGLMLMWVYLGLILVGGLVFVLLVILALVDQQFNLRARVQATQSGGDIE